jgi:hypothetical protein
MWDREILCQGRSSRPRTPANIELSAGGRDSETRVIACVA